MDITSRDSPAFVADAVHRDDPAILHEELQDTGVEFAHVPQFKQTVAERLGQRLSVILPVPQFGQTGDHRREVVRTTGLQFVQKVSHGARPRCRLIELYAEIHGDATSYLMSLAGMTWRIGTSTEFALIDLLSWIQIRRNAPAPSPSPSSVKTHTLAVRSNANPQWPALSPARPLCF